MTPARRLAARLARFPRRLAAHAPTPLEEMPNLGRDLGLALWVKRDDCTGFGFGGNKVRQLEFYLGAALADEADTILITGAVQSNFVRTAATMARRFGLDCHLQLEERVPGIGDLHRTNGNALLDRILGATLHSFPEGEDEAGADAAMQRLADGLRACGKRPYLIHLSADHPPLGALGYVAAAIELAEQMRTMPPFDEILIASGSALSHTGLLHGLRALGIATPVRGICVRRDATTQTARVARRMADLCALLDAPMTLSEDDFRLHDGAFAPGYGLLGEATIDAVRRTARTEGLFLDPVYTGKTMTGLIQLAGAKQLAGPRILFWHTGGTPALFAYADQLTG
jgi:D-cysteine desulfhydrase family pyridoxal phosphate-dependent enzyme